MKQQAAFVNDLEFRDQLLLGHRWGTFQALRLSAYALWRYCKRHTMATTFDRMPGRYRHYGYVSDPFNDEETGANTIAGILVGYALLIVFQVAIAAYHIVPWLQRNREDIPPEAFLTAGSHSLLAMMVTGGIVMAAFGPRGWTEGTILQEWYGYNNVCLVFDSPPSKYSSPVFWFFTGWYFTTYSVLDLQRVTKLTYLSPRIRYFSGAVHGIAIFVWAFFTLCLAVGPPRGHDRPHGALHLHDLRLGTHLRVPLVAN